MDSLRVFNDKHELAAAAAGQTIALLEKALAKYGTATWVLSGGTAPTLIYRIIADDYLDAIDWSKVIIIIGDERIGPLDGADNNWQPIDDVLLAKLSAIKHRPVSDQSLQTAADEYDKILASLPTTDNGLPRLDVVWLGMGQDGHTLSLFPHHDSLLPTNRLVIPVTDSPKPPSDRITLTLRALIGTGTAMILTSGDDKRQAVTDARSGGQTPIALAAHVITTHDGHVDWLVDKAAAPNTQAID